MNIIQKPSPNFNNRAFMLMIHGTGWPLKETLEFLVDGPLSVHYVIDEDGTTYQLVDEDKRAWHAGVGYWNGVTDINSASVGVELVMPSNEDVIIEDVELPEKTFFNAHYQAAQIDALIGLSQGVLNRNERIKPWNLISHQETAPHRKFDPGPNFPWKKLADEGIGLWHGLDDDTAMDTTSLSDDDAKACLTLMASYGYDLRNPTPDQIKKVVTAFQTRFIPDEICGTLNKGTYEAIQSLHEKKL